MRKKEIKLFSKDSKKIKKAKKYLSNRQIKDTDNIFKDLSDEQFKNLYELDISENLLTMLPSDLKIFDNLHILDITNNPFESVRKKEK